MTRSKIVGVASLVGLGVWSAAIIFWPATIRSPLPVEEEEVAAGSRARLFEAPLTDGNFGILGFHLYESREGQKYWNVRSQFAEFYRNADYTFLKEVEADFYSQPSGEIIRSRGDVGRSETQEKVVELEGNVLIRTEQGYDFRMDKLIYNGKRHELRSDDWVKVQGVGSDPTLKLQGRGLVGKINSEEFTLSEDVTGRKKLNNKRWLTIEAERGQFLVREKRAIFRGNVRSQLPDLKMESGKLQVEMAENREVLVASGKVKLKHKDKIGIADKAIIDVGSNRIDLKGAASVSSKGDRLQGSQILLFMDEDRVEVVGAKGRVKRGT